MVLEHLLGAKRVKRTPSPLSTNLFINSSDENSESDDERDSGTILTCPLCDSTYHHLAHLLAHAQRKHHIDLSNSNQMNFSDQIPSMDIEGKDSNEQVEPMDSTEPQSK